MPLTQPQNFFVTEVDNSFGGSAAGADNSGDRVTAIGARVAQRNALAGDDVIAIGVDALPDNLAATIIVIGNSSLPDNQAANQIVIGHGSGGAIGAGLLTGDNILIGHSVAPTGEDMARNVVIGHEAANALVIASASDFVDNVIIGNRAIANAGDAVGTMNLSVIIGSEAGLNLGSALGGYGGNVFIGRRAGQGAAIVEVAALNNVIIGEQAGLRIRTCSSNVLIGRLAGQDVTTGVGNTFVGLDAGGNISTGGANVCIGSGAARSSTSGTEESVCIGGAAGDGALADRCVIIGHRAQAGVIAGLDDAIIIGANANSSAAAGSQNLDGAILLEVIDATDRRTIMYGQHDATGSSIMFGHNNVGTGVGTARDIVALQAAGANNIVKLVDGGPAVALNPVAGGYFYVLAGALHWVGSAGTDSVVAAA